MKLLPSLIIPLLTADQCNRVLVPLYVWPAGGTTTQCGNAAYQQAALGGDKVVSIVNVANGEGSNDAWEQSMFRACFDELKSGGNTVIAYIYSQYGERSLAAMETDLDKWIDDFGFDLIDGVFIDETMSVYEDQSRLQRYTDALAMIRAKFATGGKTPFIVGNSGQVAPRELVDAFDSIVTYEQPQSNYLHVNSGGCIVCSGGNSENTLYCGMDFHPVLEQQSADLADGTLSPSKLASLTYGVPSEKLNHAIEVAVNSGTSLIYATDADLPENLWGRLPVYWDDLVGHEAFNCDRK